MAQPANATDIFETVLPRLIHRLTLRRILFDSSRRARRMTEPPICFNAPPAGYPPAHRHSHFELCFALEGQCPFLLGERCVELKPGHLVVLSPETYHRELAAEECGPYLLLWVGIHGDHIRVHLQRHLGDGQFQIETFLDPDHEFCEADSLVKALDMELWSQSVGATLRIQSILLNFCAQWLRTCPSPLRVPDAADPQTAREPLRWRIDKAIEYVNDHFAQPIDLAETAMHVGVTPTHMSTLFARNLGRTFTDYLTACRLAEARNLLADQTLSIKQIAARVGIPNQFYFSRLFRKYLGNSPQQYREFLVSTARNVKPG